MTAQIDRDRKHAEFQDDQAGVIEYRGYRLERLAQHPHMWRVTALGTSVDESLSGATYTPRSRALEAIDKLLDNGANVRAI